MHYLLTVESSLAKCHVYKHNKSLQERLSVLDSCLKCDVIYIRQQANSHLFMPHSTVIGAHLGTTLLAVGN